ncbi:hypothetical protein ACJMK2_005660 [Sinanodonta woodiana]|uniref:Protein SERAC1 n=1 Tax=Sinanodonta woodiana TaxID=1069815 RepID=A0ABD3VQR9_SINWO
MLRIIGLICRQRIIHNGFINKYPHINSWNRRPLSLKILHGYGTLSAKLLLKLGAGAVVTMIGMSGLFLWVEINEIDKRFRNMTTNVFELEKDSPYIYVSGDKKKKPKDKKASSFPMLKRLKRKVKKVIGEWTPWLQTESNDPWMLLNDAQSEDWSTHMTALKALVDHQWDDYQCRYIAQASDQRTYLGLARMSGTDFRLFRKLPRLPLAKKCIEDQFRILLSSLPKTGIDKCVKHFTSRALNEGNIDEERGGLWCFGGTGLEFTKSLSPVPDETVELFCLEALVQHSIVHHPDNCKEIVDLKGIQLLQRVYHVHGKSIVFRRLLAWIIGNLAIHKELHKDIIQGGWVTILRSWLFTKDVALYMHTTRALANLDQDNDHYGVYEDGIYLVHPPYRKMEPMFADVIFIHGLMGGPFKTWRQQDLRTGDKPLVIDEKIRETYTFCWPKDWLAKDCANTRILSISYDTDLSQWSSKCPFDIEKYCFMCLASDLNQRSRTKRSLILLEKLKKAGVGSRPTIWIGHSMGGLLIKEILRHAESYSEYSNMLQNTVGILFYSTPHKGSSLAKYSSQAKYLLYPSIEVQELNEESEQLKDLHKWFQQYVIDFNVPCLSFGETEKTPLGLNMSIVIVPPESSDPGVGEYHAIKANHLNICKPWDKESEIYNMTVKFIRKCLLKHMVDDIQSLLLGGTKKAS